MKNFHGLILDIWNRGAYNCKYQVKGLYLISRTERTNIIISSKIEFFLTVNETGSIHHSRIINSERNGINRSKTVLCTSFMHDILAVWTIWSAIWSTSSADECSGTRNLNFSSLAFNNLWAQTNKWLINMQKEN